MLRNYVGVWIGFFCIAAGINYAISSSSDCIVNGDIFQVSDNDFKVLDDVVKGIVKEKQPFERLEMKKSDLLEMFKYNQFKVGFLQKSITKCY